nr:hypothetical protein [Tanacetum cinerariifolium]
MKIHHGVESLDGDNYNDMDNEQGIEGDNEQGKCIEQDYDMGSNGMGSDHSIEMVADQGDENGSKHGGAKEEFSDHDDDNIVDEKHIINDLEGFS